MGFLFGSSGAAGNPADAAQPYLNQIPGTISPYYQPYINNGQNAMGILNSQYSNMVNNPDQIINQIGSGYQQSPGYQWNLDQGEQGINNAAAAGGYVGTPMHQQQAATLSEGLANQDYQTYLNHGLNLYGQGISGFQGFNNQGYNASNELASGLAQALTQQANLAYAGAANSGQKKGGLIGDTLGLAGSLMPSFMGGGSGGGGSNDLVKIGSDVGKAAMTAMLFM